MHQADTSLLFHSYHKKVKHPSSRELKPSMIVKTMDETDKDVLGDGYGVLFDYVAFLTIMTNSTKM